MGRKSRQYSKKNTHLQTQVNIDLDLPTYPTDMFVHLNLELKPLLEKRVLQLGVRRATALITQVWMRNIILMMQKCSYS